MRALQSTGLLLPVLLLLLPGSGYGQGLTDRVDAVFAEWDSPDSPGCALGMIRDGRLVYARGYGLADLEHDVPITSSSVFRIGSTSKQFTAMSMLLLEEQGKLSLDADVREYLPELPQYENTVTLRQMLHHTSGLRDYLQLMSLAGNRGDDFYTDADVVDMLARNETLNFPPGDQFLYSNSGYFLPSQIVQRVNGRTLRQFAEEHIFGPLGMTNTHYHDDHRMIVENRASGYTPDGDGFRISMTTLDMVGDGGVFTNIKDLLLWDRNFYDNRLGSGGQPLIERALRPGVLNDGTQLDYALGLRVNEYKGLPMVSHGGSFVGFRAQMIRFPEQSFSVACLCNLSSTNPTELAIQVADIYLVEEFRRELVAFVGEYYSNELGVTYRLVLDGDELVFRRQGAPERPLAALRDDRFRLGGWTLDFERDEDGRVAGFMISSGRARGIRFVRSD